MAKDCSEDCDEATGQGFDKRVNSRSVRIGLGSMVGGSMGMC